jgi:outer membrane receptor protein involved in Fe transport
VSMSVRIVVGLVVWLCAVLPLYAAVLITGTVRDSSGAAVADAQIVVLTAERTAVGTTRSDAQGRFTIEVPGPGRFLVVTTAEGLGEARVSVTAGATAPPPLDVRLHVRQLQEEVTVTASRSAIDDIRLAGQPVTIIDARELQERVDTVVAQAVEGEAGVALQRTSPTMAGVYVRGLTGNKVNVFVDGVRYSNGAQRGGVNTFLDLIEPGSLESIEIVRGPSSAQYGSDALGGSIQFLSRPPQLRLQGGPLLGGSAGAGAGTAHRFGSAQTFLSLMTAPVGVTASISGRRVGSLRPGRGIDSHAAATRFLGVPSSLVMDARLPDTGFDQHGESVRAQWAASSATRVVLGYTRTTQDRGRRYDQLLGGDGNLVSELNDLTLDLFSARVERLGAGLFDHATLAYSVNSQREERVNQGGNGNPAATIGHEPERTTVHGVQASATRQLSSWQTMTVGGDLYLERLTSDSFNVNPVTGAISARRPRVPDGATFTQGGVFAQTAIDMRPERLRLLGSLRVGGASYQARSIDSPLVNGAPLWPDDSLDASSVTFRAAAVVTPSAPWTFSASVSRGFRAPHMTDLGTLGLTGAGFEVAAPDVAGLGGFVGTSADGTAVSTGDPVRQLEPETSLQYEGSAGYRRRSWRTDVTVFVNHIADNIQKQALILPQGAVGLSLGGQPIVSQNAGGAVFVSASTVPVLVRANFDDARIWGVEHALEAMFSPALTLRTAFTYIRAVDTGTDLPPNIEGGTPAPDLFVTLRWSPTRRFWVEPYAHAAARQTRLSTLDLGDRRIGAGRTRASIRTFFLNGATARGWVGAGADNAPGSADDVLLATGETLAQIQDRVLGPGVNSSSLYPAIPGYVTGGIRAGLRFGPHEVIVDAENLNDRNYRGVSWGVDAPGRGVSIKYAVKF